MGNGVSEFGDSFRFSCRLLSDALPLTLKLTFHPKTGKLYGAQCVGYEGVDKRIDQIAGLIKRGGTVYDLMETEHAYAPPFSSAKDPIAIAGYVASNIISGAMPVISWRELAGKKDGIMLIDTRTPEEFSFGTIPELLIFRWMRCAAVCLRYPKTSLSYFSVQWDCGDIWHNEF